MSFGLKNKKNTNCSGKQCYDDVNSLHSSWSSTKEGNRDNESSDVKTWNNIDKQQRVSSKGCVKPLNIETTHGLQPFSSSSSLRCDGKCLQLASRLGTILSRTTKRRTIDGSGLRCLDVDDSNIQNGCRNALLAVIQDFSKCTMISNIMSIVATGGNVSKEVKTLVHYAHKKVMDTLGRDVNSTKVTYLVVAALIASVEHAFIAKYTLEQITVKYYSIFRNTSSRGGTLVLPLANKEWYTIHRIANLIDIASTLLNPCTNKTVIFYACTYLGGGDVSYSTGGGMNNESKRIYNCVLHTECRDKTSRSLEPVKRKMTASTHVPCKRRRPRPRQCLKKRSQDFQEEETDPRLQVIKNRTSIKDSVSRSRLRLPRAAAAAGIAKRRDGILKDDAFFPSSDSSDNWLVPPPITEERSSCTSDSSGVKGSDVCVPYEEDIIYAIMCRDFFYTHSGSSTIVEGVPIIEDPLMDIPLSGRSPHLFFHDPWTSVEEHETEDL